MQDDQPVFIATVRCDKQNIESLLGWLNDHPPYAAVAQLEEAAQGTGTEQIEDLLHAVIASSCKKVTLYFLDEHDADETDERFGVVPNVDFSIDYWTRRNDELVATKQIIRAKMFHQAMEKWRADPSRTNEELSLPSVVNYAREDQLICKTPLPNWDGK
jgi:hypothetical protein